MGRSDRQANQAWRRVKSVSYAPSMDIEASPRGTWGTSRGHSGQGPEVHGYIASGAIRRIHSLPRTGDRMVIDKMGSVSCRRDILLGCFLSLFPVHTERLDINKTAERFDGFMAIATLTRT